MGRVSWTSALLFAQSRLTGKGVKVQERKQRHLEADERVLNGDRELLRLVAGYVACVSLPPGHQESSFSPLTRTKPAGGDEDRDAKALPLRTI